jgi:subtilisin family serine protease
MARRLALSVVPLVLLAAVIASAGGGAVHPGGKPAGSSSPAKIDLATYPAERWIVQLNGAPLATYRGGLAGLRATAAVATGASRLNVSSARSREYIRHLRDVQRAFAQRLLRRIPGAHVQRNYQVVLNALAVKMSRTQAAIARRLKGVRAITPDIPYQLQMFSTPTQIGAPALWGQLGGQGNAGAGVKVAIIDTGIFVRHDDAGAYTGNACFDDTGYTAPAGYPLGDARFTNNKVIVARAYFRPDDPPIPSEDTPIQGTTASSPHGTHVAGTVACNAGTAAAFLGSSVPISGVAPRAYLMNYRVFYPSQSAEDFQNQNGYTVELVEAIEDAVKDGADVISNSWGSSYQNTLAWPDPMIQAADDAVAAGVVMVFANGNSGPATGTVIAPAISPKVIGVGAATKDAALVSAGSISVTAPEPVPAYLRDLPFGRAFFGPSSPGTTGPAAIVPAESVSTAASDKSFGCSLAGDASPFPAGSLTGSIALIERGTCSFSEKVYNAQRGGAIAAFVYNDAAGGDALMNMGFGAHFVEVTIPSWFLGRTNGLNLVAFANANPATAQAQFHPTLRVVPSPGDVVIFFSSRGPSMDKLIKPDVVAPGVTILSSGYGPAGFPNRFTGFGTVSGTSMATPHVAGSAALLKQLHPTWTPEQIKSALMTTATEDVWLDPVKVTRAGVLDRGAGRVDLTRAGTPGLTLNQPSFSAGEITAGGSVDFTLRATDVSGAGGTWDVSAIKTGSPATIANFEITPNASSLTVPPDGSSTLTVRIQALAAAAPGEYEGKVVLSNVATGRTLHVPVWMRVLTSSATADVLLLDDDGSSVPWASQPDYSSVYTNALTALGVSYTYRDAFTQGLPSLAALHGYKVVLIFTGRNTGNENSGLTGLTQQRLAEWLDSGGRLWTTGQNFAEVSDSNFSYSSPSLGRSRLYHGYLGLRYVAGTAYAFPVPVPRPTATGLGPMAGLTLDLSRGADGAGNQASIEVSSPLRDNDTYQAAHTMTPLFRAIDSPVQGASDAISFGRSSEQTLEEERLEYRYRSVSMGFGLEGVNSTTGFTSRGEVTRATLNWLLDRITFGAVAVTSQKDKDKPKKKSVLTASPASSIGATFTQLRWDFGDGSPYETTATRRVDHKYQHWGTYTVRVEATDSLGHRAVQTQIVAIEKD